jgi:WD40 repeat protein
MSLNLPLMADIELASVSRTLKEMQDSTEEQAKESRNQLKKMVSLEADVRSAKTTTMKLKTAACRFHYLTHRPHCLVIIYEGGLISLFDLKTRKQVEKSASHRLSNLRSSCMSPDEKLIAVAGESSIEIFEFTVTGICRLTEFKLIDAQVLDIVFHNNDSFYSAGSDGKIKIWYISMKRNEVLLSLNSEPTRIIYGAGYLIIADERGCLHKYSHHFRIKSDSNRAHKAEITALMLSDSEKLFASGSKDGTIKIWSFVTFEELQVLTLSGGITNLNFGIYDLYLAAIHDSSTQIYVWKVGFDHDPVILDGHSDSIYDIYFTDSSSCAMLYTSSRDKSLKISPYITNIRDARCLKSQTKEFYRYLHAFDKSNVFINNGTSIEIWDMDYTSDGKQHAAKMLTNKHPKGLMTVIFCEYVRYKKILLVITQHAIIKYDTTTWEYITAEIDSEYQELKCCVIIPEKNVFLTGGSIGLINIRDLDTLEIISYMQEDGDAIESMDYLPNSNIMVSTTGKRIYLWNLTLRICSKKSSIFDFEIYQIKATKDEKHLITLNDERNLSFWGLEYFNYKWSMYYDKDLIRSAHQPKNSPNKILKFMLSDDDKYIYVVWSNATIEVWVRQTRVKITYINLAKNFDFIQLHDSQKHFYYGTAEGVRKVKNPITIDYFYIYHPKYSISKTIEVLNKIIDDKMYTNYDKEMDDIFIAPYHMNIISIYSYFGLINFLKKSLKRNFAVFEDKDGISPLDVSIELKDIEVLEAIMDKFVHNVKHNKFLAKLLESTIIELNYLGLECLPKVYDALWRISHNPKLSKFARKNQVLPLIHPSHSMVVLQERFFGDTNIPVEDRGTLVIFRYSLIPFYLHTGSTKSFEFLMSISECPNSQILQGLSFITNYYLFPLSSKSYSFNLLHLRS